MILSDLQPRQEFELGNEKFEVKKIYPGGRIAVCYELDEDWNRKAVDIPLLPEDTFIVRLVSDIRFNDQHATAYELCIERQLKDLL